MVRFIVPLLAIVSFSGSDLLARPASASRGSSPPTRNKTDYLGKDYIDSTVLRAIFIISDAAGTAGVGFRTKESLDEAWRIARKVKAEAKGDPNERYALWKVNELEWLIRLEERDMVMQKMMEGQATVNQIVADYNAEVGKSRPDFKNLTRMHARMLEFDTRQADAMASSINKRVRTLSREAVLGLERSLLARNSAQVDREYKYLLRNRPYLKISGNTFDDLESRASACARAQDEIPTVKVETGRARKLVEMVQIAEARNMLALAQYRFSDIRNFVPEMEATRLYRGIRDVEGRLSDVEDSLVRVNLDILSRKGVKAANDYLQYVVREKGVCRDKAARIDQAILAVGSPEKSDKISREIDDVAAAAENSPEKDIIGEMRSKAMKKAQKKLDSMRVEDEKRAQREKKRQDSIDAVARKAATEEYRKNRELTVRIASKIYDLIENKKARIAFDMFSTKHALLRRYLSSDAYATLESAVNQARDPNWDSGYDQIFYLSPVAEKSSGHRIVPSAGSAAGANKEKAMTIITEIYGMLDRDEKAEAQGHFDREKSFLQTYLDKDAFDMINAMMVQVGR
jgi:hypothetical protein